jgi:hypothetical protein
LTTATLSLLLSPTVDSPWELVQSALELPISVKEYQHVIRHLMTLRLVHTGR